MPLRVTFWDKDNKPALDTACTYDISACGARISGLRSRQETGEIVPGEIIAIERGRNKTFCRVVWVGNPDSEQRGQVGIQNVEIDRPMWEAELRDMDNVFDAIPREKISSQVNPGLRRTQENRRRRGRFEVIGAVELTPGDPNEKRSKVKETGVGKLRDLSELGCSIETEMAPQLGVIVELILKIDNQELKVLGEVKRVDYRTVGIEFDKIRKGDRQLLQFLLQKLADRQLENTVEFEFSPN